MHRHCVSFVSSGISAVSLKSSSRALYEVNMLEIGIFAMKLSRSLHDGYLAPCVKCEMQMDEAVIADFTPNEVVGCGSFGVAFRIYNVKDGSGYVMKVLSKIRPRDDDQGVFTKYFKEQQALDFPFYLPIKLSFKTGFNKRACCAVATPLYLSSLATATDLNPTQKSIILCGIAAAMQYLHSKNIIHGHLFPTNVLLDSNNYPLVTDANIGSLIKDDLPRLIVNKRAAYLAPEFFAPKSKYDKKSADVYSFGILAYQLIIGNLPFSVKMTPPEIVIASLKGDIQIPSSLPLAMVNLLKYCLNYSPKLRPTFDQILSSYRSMIIPGSDISKIDEFMNTYKIKTTGSTVIGVHPTLTKSMAKDLAEKAGIPTTSLIPKTQIKEEQPEDEVDMSISSSDSKTSKGMNDFEPITNYWTTHEWRYVENGADKGLMYMTYIKLTDALNKHPGDPTAIANLKKFVTQCQDKLSNWPKKMTEQELYTNFSRFCGSAAMLIALSVDREVDKIQYLNIAADCHIREANQILATIYFDKKDNKKAYAFALKAANAGSSSVDHILKACTPEEDVPDHSSSTFEYSTFTDPIALKAQEHVANANCFFAFECLMQVKEPNDQQLKCLYEICLDHRNIGEELPQARDGFKFCAKNKFPGAALEYGEMCALGEGGIKNEQDAMEYLNAKTKTELNDCMLKCAIRVMKCNKKRGISQLEQLSNNRFVPAMITLAQIYQKDLATEEKARNLYSKAKDQGSKEAADALAYMLAHPLLKPDELYDLGVEFQAGIGRDIDLTTAADYFRQGALLGHAQSCYAYGALRLLGQGVKMDRAEGLRWIAKARRLGYNKQ